MRCGNCGAQNADGSEFCGYCGAKLAPTDSNRPQGGGGPQIPHGLRPMGIGDILDESIRLYRQNFRLIITVFAAVLIPVFVLSIINLLLIPTSTTTSLFSSAGSSSRYSTASLGGAILVSVGIGIVSCLAYLLGFVALVRVAAERFLGRESSLGLAYSGITSSFLRALGASIVLGIIFFVLFLVVSVVFGIAFGGSVGLAALGGLSTSSSSATGAAGAVGALLCIGFVAMLIGTVVMTWLGVRWTFYVQAIVVDNKGVLSSLSRSWGLVGGKWWKSFFTLLLAGLLMLVLLAIAYGVELLVIYLVGASVVNSTVSSVIVSVISSVFGLVIYPLFPIVLTVLYFDLRTRKEGLDLQVLDQRLSQV